jgi:adenine-specific DNA glycosylase
VVAAIEYRGRLLFERRALNGFLGGLWELPGTYLQEGEAHSQGLKRVRKQVGGRLRARQIPEEDDFSVKHVYSHFEESNRVFVCEGTGGANSGRSGDMEQRFRWIHPTRLESYPVTGATTKILRKLEKNRADQ